MDVRDHATPGDRSLDEGVEFFVSSNSKLQMARCDPFHFEILASVSGQFKYLGREVFQNS